MSVPEDSAKTLSAGVWAVSFIVLFFCSFLLGGLIATEVAIFGVFLSTFIIAPALAIYTYLRVSDDEDDIWHSLVNSSATEDTGGTVSDEQFEITMIDTGNKDDSEPDSLTTLRERYATGELTEEQFEHKVDQLLQTDSPENAAEWRNRTRESIKE